MLAAMVRRLAGALPVSLVLGACGGSTPHPTPHPAHHPTLHSTPHTASVTRNARRSPSHRAGASIQGGFTIGATVQVGSGGALRPPVLVLNPGDGLRLTLRDTDELPHVVTIVVPAQPRTLTLASGSSTVVTLTQLRTGRFPLQVDGRSRGRLVVGAKGGP